MSDRNQLEALARRCEAGAPDVLDVCDAIALALGIPFKPFTTSLDSAMSLVPEGWSVQIIRTADSQYGNANLYWFRGGNSIPAKKMHGAGATPALALCAAALRARSGQ